MDKGKNSNMASVHVDLNNWYDLGMGRMKMECWEFLRKPFNLYKHQPDG